MKKYITVLLLLIMTISCTNKTQNKNKLSEEKIVASYKGQGYSMTEKGKEPTEIEMYKIQIGDKNFDIAKGTYEDLLTARKILEESDFKPLLPSDFREKILNLYNIDMNDHYRFTLTPILDKDHVIDIVMHSGYLILANGRIDDLDQEGLVMYNKMILNNDTTAFNWMKLNRPEDVIRQVQELGVISNPKWLKFSFDNSNFWQEQTLHDYIFGNSYDDEKYHIRKNMLDTLISYGADMSLLSSALESVEYTPQMYAGDTNEIIGYLYTKVVEVGQYGYIESRLDGDKDLIKKLKNDNYYNSEDLKYFCEETYIVKAEREKQGKSSSLSPEPAYMTSDPDGYVNIRKGGSPSAEIIGRISSGKYVTILSKDINGWWKVEFNDKVGYVHSSRLILRTK